MYKKTLIGIAVFVVLCFGAMGWWYWNFLNAQKQSATQTPFAYLQENNAAFAEATALFRAGKYAEARVKYEESLALAKNPVQEGQIQIKVALSQQGAGDLHGALKTYQSIAANNTYIKFVRAYAVQSLGKLYDLNGDPAILEETFSVEPFASMRVEGNVPRSYRRLYEYASSFYPLAESELKIGTWYVNVLIGQKRGTVTLAATTTDSFMRVVHQKLASAERDILRVQKDPNESFSMPEILKRKAILLSGMAELGEATREEVNRAYVTAMNSYATLGGEKDGFMRFYYALYLANIGANAEVVSTLSPFYTTSVYASSQTESFFRTERENYLGRKASLRRLAGVDVNFKQYLETLGWTSADF